MADLFEGFTPKRIRQFDTWNVLGLLVSLGMLIVWAVTVSNRLRPFQFQDLALLAGAIASAAVSLEPAFPRDHLAARTLRVLAILTFAVAIMAAVAMFLPGDSV